MDSASETGGDLMSGDPGLTKFIKRLETRLAGLTGVQVFVDRTDDEPLTPDERPAVVIRAVDETLDERQEQGDSAQVHACTIDLDFYADANTLDNLGFQHNQMIADAVALIQADWTLDGLVYELTMASVTSASDSVPAVGVAILTTEVKFLTRFDDWTVVLGANGPIN